MKNKLFLIFLFLNISLFSQEVEDTQTPPVRVDESTLTINGADNGNNPVVINTDNVIGISDYLTVIFILILVIAVLYFVLKVIKKIGGNRIGLDNDLIHVLSTKALKGTTALHLIEVGNQIFLIGATDSHISAISEITEQESKDMIALNLSTDNVPQTSFFQHFTEKLKKNNINIDGEEASPSIKTNIDKLNRY